MDNPVVSGNGRVLSYDCPIHRGARMTWRANYETYDCFETRDGIVWVNHHEEA